MFIGGLDIGTTGCKLTVYNEKAELLAIEYREYNLEGRSDEINPEDIYESVGKVIKGCREKTEIDVIGVTSFGETFVILDDNDNVLMPSLLYTHPSGKEEYKIFDEKKVSEIACVKPGSMFSIPKLMWIKKHHPEIYKKAKRILLMQDYIVYKLTGNAFIDYSLGARTMGMDIKNKCWSDEIFSIAGVDKDKMSQLVPTGTVAGKSSKFGLKDTAIVCGCHDQIAACVGTGVYEEGIASDGIGTVECITPVMREIPRHKEFYEKGYAIIPFMNEGKYVTYAFTFAGGAALKWYKTNFQKDLSYKELDEFTDPQKPTGIILVPHFAGAATPSVDADTKAIFSGVTFNTKKEDLYQALLEGITYEMLLNLEMLKENGINPKKLMASGGGSKSEKWLQIKANILNLPIVGTKSLEAGTLGTIMIAGVGVGAFENIREAQRVFVEENDVYYPDVKAHEEYMKYYEKYKKLRDAMKDFS